MARRRTTTPDAEDEGLPTQADAQAALDSDRDGGAVEAVPTEAPPAPLDQSPEPPPAEPSEPPQEAPRPSPAAPLVAFLFTSAERRYLGDELLFLNGIYRLRADDPDVQQLVDAGALRPL